MAKNCKETRQLPATPQGNLVFSAVAENIERVRRQSSTARITKIDGKNVDIYFPGEMAMLDPKRDNLSGLQKTTTYFPGADVTMGFDSFESLHRFVDEKYPPETGAWKRIAHIAREAKSDLWINKSQQAVAFLGMIEAIADRAMGNYSAAEVLSPLSDFLKSEQARRNAQSKNEKARTWVLTEWGKGLDSGQSKAAFSRQHSGLVKSKFDLLINPDTIARDWLPKSKK